MLEKIRDPARWRKILIILANLPDVPPLLVLYLSAIVGVDRDGDDFGRADLHSSDWRFGADRTN